MLNETDESVYNQEKFVQMMRLCWERKMLPVNEFVNELASLGREKQKSFLMHCIRMLRENFVRNFGIEKIVYMTEREKTFSTRFSPYVHEGNIIPLFDEFERAYSDIIRNGNGKIIFTDLCIKVMQNIRPWKTWKTKRYKLKIEPLKTENKYHTIFNFQFSIFN